MNPVPQVLLVESDPDFRAMIADALSASYACDAVASCAAALLKIREASYTHIVVDVDSPIPMDALCAALMAEPALLAKVVVISDGDVPEGLGGQPMLRKPFDRESLTIALSPRERADA